MTALYLRSNKKMIYWLYQNVWRKNYVLQILREADSRPSPFLPLLRKQKSGVFPSARSRTAKPPRAAELAKPAKRPFRVPVFWVQKDKGSKRTLSAVDRRDPAPACSDWGRCFGIFSFIKGKAIRCCSRTSFLTKKDKINGKKS